MQGMCSRILFGTVDWERSSSSDHLESRTMINHYQDKCPDICLNDQIVFMMMMMMMMMNIHYRLGSRLKISVKYYRILAPLLLLAGICYLTVFEVTGGD